MTFPKTETLIYGIPAGATERYNEALLSTKCNTPAEIEALKARASADGWHSFRIDHFTPGSAPDFAKVLA